MIELSDHVTRLNRRESSQLDLRLRQLKRQEQVMKRSYEREMCDRRLQLEQINDTLNETFEDFIRNTREDTLISIHSIKMRRNQSAPPNIKRTDVSNQIPPRPYTTTATPFRLTKRAMTVFREMTVKPSCPSLANLLVLARPPPQQEWTIRSKTMMNLRKDH